MIRSPLALIATCTLVGGCSALGALTKATEPLDAYQIQAPATGAIARGAPKAEDLIVEIPAASGAIDTDRILIRPTATQVQYLPDGRWIEPAPLMIQSALVEGLERSGAFRFVGRKPLGSSGDVALVSNLVNFHAMLVPGTKGARIEVQMTARLVREEDASVLASKAFSSSVQSPDTSDAAIVAAYDQATTAVIGETIAWVLQQRGLRIETAQATQ